MVTRRHGALALSGLLVAALVLAEAHRATALHAICSKHGKVIHVLSDERREAPRSTATAFASDTTAAFEGVHGCAALLLLTTALVGPLPATSTLALRAVPAQGQPPRGLFTAHPVPLLLQAPKHSPPTA
jgi:hypothetical protein